MSSVELDFPMRKAKITYGRRRASSGVSRISNNSPAPLTDTDSSDEGESVAVERSLVKGKGKGKERASPAKKSKVESPRARTEDVVEWDEGVVQSTSKLAVSPSAAKGVKWPKKSGKRSRDEQGNFIKREPATVIPAPTKRSVTLSNPIPHASTPKRSPTRPKSTRSSLPNPIPPPAKPATTPTKRQIIKEPATAPIATNQPTASTSTAIREIDLLDSPYPDKKKARISDPVAPVVIEPPSPAPVSPAKDLSSVFSMYASSDRNLVAVAGKRKTLGKTGSGLISQLGARSIRLTGDGVAEPTIDPGTTFSRAHTPVSSPESSQRQSNPPSPSRYPPTFAPSFPSPSHAADKALNRASTVIGGGENGRGVVGAVKKTYGGARSYKRDMEEERIYARDAAAPINSTPSGSHPPGYKSSGIAATRLFPLPPPVRERETYSVLRRRWGVDVDEGNDSGEDGLEQSDLKSITQLRAKGENARFVDEFNYLVEGLEGGQGLGVRRVSAIEVLRKLLDKEFVARLKSSGFVERIYTEFRKAEAGAGDRVLDSSIAFLVAFLVRDQRLAEPLLRVTTDAFSTTAQDEEAVFNEPTCDVLEILVALLSRSWAGEIIGAGAKGMSKADARVLAIVREIVDKSTLMECGSLPITVKSISLVAISIIASFPPRSSTFLPQYRICTSGALDAVISGLVQETRGLEARMQKYEAGLDLLPSDGSINLDSLDTCLRICEACIAATPIAVVTLTQNLVILTPALSTLLLACSILIVDPSDLKTRSVAMEILLSVFRLLLALTTVSPDWSVALAGTSLAVPTLIKLIVATRTPTARAGGGSFVVGKGDSEQSEGEGDGGSVSYKFDVLCLALGVLTNLVETADGIRNVLRETLIDGGCREARKCARRCQCSGATTAIDRLCDLYLDPLQDSTNEVESSFIHGYSGILLGLILLDTPPNQSIVKSALQSEPEAMENLVQAMEEFATMHEKEDREQAGLEPADSGVDEEEVQSEVAGKIRLMLKQLRSL